MPNHQPLHEAIRIAADPLTVLQRIVQQALVLLPQADALWGGRLVALVRPLAGADASALITALSALAQALPASQRPRHWRHCPVLERTAAGKWERPRWRAWLQP